MLHVVVVVQYWQLGTHCWHTPWLATQPWLQTVHTAGLLQLQQFGPHEAQVLPFKQYPQAHWVHTEDAVHETHAVGQVPQTYVYWSRQQPLEQEVHTLRVLEHELQVICKHELVKQHKLAVELRVQLATHWLHQIWLTQLEQVEAQQDWPGVQLLQLQGVEQDKHPGRQFCALVSTAKPTMISSPRWTERANLNILQQAWSLCMQHIINISMNKNSNEGLNYKVYWEKQGLDSLCGVHCINSLLQGPFFDEIALSHLALQLDKKQHELMAAEGMTSDLIKYMKEESGNVAMDGNYSIQVLQEALKTMGLSMVSIEALGEKEDLNNKKAFICNNAAHWIAIRKINGVWYNLNSLGMRLPEIISDFYLSAFIMSVKECGFQVFSVEGDFPPAKEEQFEHVNDHQEWYPAKRIKKYQQKKMKRKGYKPNISGGGTDKEMEKAIALSLGKKYETYKSSGEDSDWDDDNKKKEIKPFAGTGVSMAGDTYIHYDKFEIDSEDVEMVSIMKMAIEEKLKAEIKDGVDVIFRLPDGKKKSQKFSPEEPISNLYDFIWVDRNPKSRFYLVDMGSKNKLLDLQIPVMSIEDPNDHTVMVNVCDV